MWIFIQKKLLLNLGFFVGHFFTCNMEGFKLRDISRFSITVLYVNYLNTGFDSKINCNNKRGHTSWVSFELKTWKKAFPLEEYKFKILWKFEKLNSVLFLLFVWLKPANTFILLKQRDNTRGVWHDIKVNLNHS